jgi:phytoene dehydrogenase-like protein
MMPHVIVVGAGISGLCAAYRLAEAGLRVKVLERGSRVGGRMTTDAVDGFVLDRGAQFLSSEYTVLRSLADAVGLRTA